MVLVQLHLCRPFLTHYNGWGPLPVALVYTGQLLLPGQVPPTRDLPRGWSAVAPLAEDSTLVSEAFGSLINAANGVKVHVSEFRFLNQLSFDFDTGQITFNTGSFESLSGPTSTIDPGDAVWVFNTNATTFVPK